MGAAVSRTIAQRATLVVVLAVVGLHMISTFLWAAPSSSLSEEAAPVTTAHMRPCSGRTGRSSPPTRSRSTCAWVRISSQDEAGTETVSEWVNLGDVFNEQVRHQILPTRTWRIPVSINRFYTSAYGALGRRSSPWSSPTTSLAPGRHGTGEPHRGPAGLRGERDRHRLLPARGGRPVHVRHPGRARPVAGRRAPCRADEHLHAGRDPVRPEAHPGRRASRRAVHPPRLARPSPITPRHGPLHTCLRGVGLMTGIVASATAWLRTTWAAGESWMLDSRKASYGTAVLRIGFGLILAVQLVANWGPQPRVGLGAASRRAASTPTSTPPSSTPSSAVPPLGGPSTSSIWR
ncbi:hypothetical protein NKG05_25380 [Oerskovia sp. M15]